ILIKGTYIITLSVTKYKYEVPKKCCRDGAHRNDDETCEQRAARVTRSTYCVRAFKECCIIANQYRDNESHKGPLLLGRSKYGISIRILSNVGNFV
uniref:Anaphylatoxin-like domain-containing protein n=1 Tax=Sciurus vulgaris TaxID=55149 RepID=A0A8D2D760_SCIVU